MVGNNRLRFVRRVTVVWLALAAGMGGACGGKKGSGSFALPPVPVEVADAKRSTVRETLHALGSIEAAERVKIAAEIDAVVRGLPFEEGRLVAKGQPIALFNDSELKAEALRAEALRNQARLNFERFRQLAEQNVASSQDRENSEAALKVAEANLKLAHARLEKTRIEVPFEGVVGRRLVSPGAFLRIGDVITDLARIDTVKLFFAVPERYLADLKRGAKVTVTTVAYPGKEFSGAVDVIDPILDPGTRSARLVAVIPNPKRQLRPGMSADVTAVLAERPDAVTVPDEAIFAEGDRNYLFVVKSDSTVNRQVVELGAREPGRVEVTRGVQAGEKVVRAGHQKLLDGAKVSPVGGAAESTRQP